MSKSSFFNFLSRSYNAALESKAPSKPAAQNNASSAVDGTFNDQTHMKPPPSSPALVISPLSLEGAQQEQSQSLELPGLKQLETLYSNKSKNSEYPHHYYKVDSDEDSDKDNNKDDADKYEVFASISTKATISEDLSLHYQTSPGPISPQTTRNNGSQQSKYEKDFHYQQIAEDEDEDEEIEQAESGRSLSISVEQFLVNDRALNPIQSPPPIKRHLADITSPKQMEVDDNLSPMGDVAHPED